MKTNKKIQLTALVRDFMEDNFDEKPISKALYIIDELSQEINVPFVKGKLNLWACAIIYCVSKEMQHNSDSVVSLDDICAYFKTKKALVLKRSGRIEEIINSDDEYFEKYFDKIYKIFHNGNVEKAFGMLDDIDEDDPKYFTSLVYRSMFLLDMGKYQESDEFIKKAILLKAKNNYDDPFMLIDYDDYYQLACIGFDFFEEDDFDNAIKYFDLSLDLYPNQSEVLCYKAFSLDSIGKTEEAIGELDNAIELNPDDGKLWVIKANCLSQLAKFDDAMSCYDKALEFFPDDDDILFAKGLCLDVIKRGSHSSEFFEEDDDFEYSEDQLNIEKALFFINNNKIDKAIDCLNKVSKKCHDDLRYLLAMGQIKFDQNDYDKSLEYFDKCLEIDDEFEPALLFKIIIYGSFKNDDDTFEDSLNKLHQINPEAISTFMEYLEDN